MGALLVLLLTVIVTSLLCLTDIKVNGLVQFLMFILKLATNLLSQQCH